MSVVGVVVPTIGQRPQYIESTLRSIRNAGETFVVLVGRKDFNGKTHADSGLVDLYIDEEDSSLPGKINQVFDIGFEFDLTAFEVVVLVKHDYCSGGNLDRGDAIIRNAHETHCRIPVSK